MLAELPCMMMIRHRVLGSRHGAGPYGSSPVEGISSLRGVQATTAGAVPATYHLSPHAPTVAYGNRQSPRLHLAARNVVAWFCCLSMRRRNQAPIIFEYTLIKQKPPRKRERDSLCLRGGASVLTAQSLRPRYRCSTGRASVLTLRR